MPSPKIGERVVIYKKNVVNTAKYRRHSMSGRYSVNGGLALEQGSVSPHRPGMVPVPATSGGGDQMGRDGKYLLWLELMFCAGFIALMALAATTAA